MEKPPSGSGWTYDKDPLAEIDEIYQSLIETVHFPDPNTDEANTSNSQPHRKGIPWTEDEHQLFLMGLNRYGKGDWKSISRHYVITKTPTQVASHGQKYFRRQTCSTPLDKRRPSIHDIQTVNPTAITSVPQPQINCDELGSRGLINPMLYKGFRGGMIVQNTTFLPMSNSVSPSAYPALNQAPVGSNMLRHCQTNNGIDCTCFRHCRTNNGDCGS